MKSSRWRSEPPLILASFFIGFVIWIMASLTILDTEELVVPVKILDQPPNVRIEFSPHTIPIVVRFPQTQRSRIIPQNFEVRVELGTIFDRDPRKWAGLGEPKIYPHDLDLDHVHATDLPQSVRVSKIGSPGRIQIEASLITLKVPVRVHTTGYLPANYELGGNLAAEPAEVLVTASPEVLRKWSEPGAEIPTEPVRLDGRTGNIISDFVKLQLPEELQLCDEQNRSIGVTGGIREREESRAITGVPFRILVYNDKLEARFTPREAEVRVKASLTLLSRIEPGMFTFVPKDRIAELPAAPKEIELEIKFAEDAPAEIRQNVVIEGFSPQTANLEFVRKAEVAP